MDNKEYEFDYVIFADGYNSLGRAKLFPQLHLELANYVAWRGLVNVQQIDPDLLLKCKYDKGYYRYLYEYGHLLLFPIPNYNAINTDDYLINWVLYDNITAHSSNVDLIELTKHNFVPGTLPQKHKDYLCNLANTYLPQFPLELILSTKLPFTQSISDVLLPNYVQNRVCLLGDASTLLRPHVGSNATKALQDALALSNYLAIELNNRIPNWNRALLAWNDSQNKKASHLFPLSRALGELLVTHVPDLATLDKKRMDQLWENTVKQYSWYGNKDSNQF